MAPNEKIRNTADGYENKLGISRLRGGRTLDGRHSLLGVPRELAVGCPVRFGWRPSGSSEGQCFACAAGVSIGFDGATEPNHGAARACATSALQPNGDRAVQPTPGIACIIASHIPITGTSAATSAVPSYTRTDDNTAC
jgi:hypothetical protein